MRDYQALMAELSRENEDVEKGNRQPNLLIRKDGMVVRKSPYALNHLKVGDRFSPEGKYLSETPRSRVRRTVVFGEPVQIDSKTYYLELKGYGQDGRDLTFQEHCEGDIFYGMYLDNAIKEFERLERAQQLGLPAVLPVAAVRIPREEYIRTGLPGFKFSLMAAIRMEFIDRGKLAALVGEAERKNATETADKLVVMMMQKYPNDFERGVEEVLSSLGDGYHPEIFQPLDAAKALLSRREVGYVVRASMCPIRVGDPRDKNIDTPQNRIVAKEMGITFRILLENGILHNSPATGNWTVAGELTDFTDTFDLSSEKQEIQRHLEWLEKEKQIKSADMREFVAYLIGPRHSGVLSPFFIEGMYDTPMSLGEAVEKTLKYF